MQVLLDRNANVEAKESMERTPLHIAATRGHVDVVKAQRRFSQSWV